MTDTGFTEWFTEAAADGKLYGQSPRKIAEMAWQAGYRHRKSLEFEAVYDAQGHRDELTAMFPSVTGRQTIKPYDLPVPPEVDWSEIAADGANWMREIARRGTDYGRKGKSDVFQGRTDPVYEVPGPKLTDEDVRNVKDSLAPGLLPGMTAAREAYDRHFGAPGPVPAIPGLNGKPGEDEPYDDEES